MFYENGTWGVRQPPYGQASRTGSEPPCTLGVRLALDETSLPVLLLGLCGYWHFGHAYRHVFGGARHSSGRRQLCPPDSVADSLCWLDSFGAGDAWVCHAAIGDYRDVLVVLFHWLGALRCWSWHSLQPFLAAISPDLVALQDARGKPGYYRTHPAYGVYQEVRDEGEFVLLSQHPVMSQSRLTAAGFPSADQSDVLYGVRWEIDWNGHAIAFYSIHFPSPRRYLGHTGLRSLVPEVARWLGGAAADANAYWQWRKQLSQKLARLLQEETLPWIMAGDLNTPPRGAGYACLADVGVDLHKECGSGFGFTFPGDTRNPLAGGQPWMRLDYVFADSKFWQGKWLRPESDGRSQHRPLAAALHMRIAEKNESKNSR